MKKNILTAIMLSCLFLGANAQVGINQENPKANLDIEKSPTGSLPEGFLIPKLTIAELDAKESVYGEDQDGALIFVSNAPGTSGKKTSEITLPGFHFYTAGSVSKWTGISPDLGNGSFTPTMAQIAVPNLGGLVDWANYANYNYFEFYQTPGVTASTINFPKVTDFPNKTIYIRNNSTYTLTYGNAPKNLPPDYPTGDGINNTADLGQLKFIFTDSAQQFYSDGTRWYIMVGRD